MALNNRKKNRSNVRVMLVAVHGHATPLSLSDPQRISSIIWLIIIQSIVGYMNDDSPAHH